MELSLCFAFDCLAIDWISLSRVLQTCTSEAFSTHSRSLPEKDRKKKRKNGVDVRTGKRRRREERTERQTHTVGGELRHAFSTRKRRVKERERKSDWPQTSFSSFLLRRIVALGDTRGREGKVFRGPEGLAREEREEGVEGGRGRSGKKKTRPIRPPCQSSSFSARL